MSRIWWIARDSIHFQESEAKLNKRLPASHGVMSHLSHCNCKSSLFKKRGLFDIYFLKADSKFIKLAIYLNEI